MIFKWWKFLTLLLLWPTLCLGQMMTDEQEQVQSAAKNPDTKRFSLGLSSAILTSMHRFDDPAKVFGSDTNASATYSFSSFTGFASFGGTKNFTGKRQWHWNDASLGATRSIGALGDISVRGTVLSIIPLSEDSVKARGMQSGFVAYPSFTLPIDAIPGLSVDYRPTASFYFHKYEVSLRGPSNAQYALGNRLMLRYSPLARLSLSLSGTYSREWTYANNTRDEYGLTSSIGWMAQKWLSLEAGHTTSGQPLKANGTETELSLFDTRESLIYMAMGIRY